MKKINNVFQIEIIASVIGVLILLFIPMFNTDTTKGYDFIKILSGTPEIDQLTKNLAIAVLSINALIMVLSILGLFNHKFKPSKKKIMKKIRNNIDKGVMVLSATLIVTYFSVLIASNSNFSNEDNVRFAENMYLAIGFYIYFAILLILPVFLIVKSKEKKIQ